MAWIKSWAKPSSLFWLLKNSLGFHFYLFCCFCYKGLAGFANFKSAARGNEPNSFLLEWTSESHTPIEEFELTWRQEDGQWEGFTVEAHKVNEISWAGKHAFTGLSTATRFEVKVSAKNEEGWSRLSPSFHFATFGAGKYT